MRDVVVSEYQSNWPAQFEAEAVRIHRVLGPELVYVHHIGSTAVPGLAAKPIIDIMPVVRDIEALDRMTDAMTSIGYEAFGEWGIGGRRYFAKIDRDHDGRHTHHVHAYQVGHQDVLRHLAFRDYLRANPMVAAQYAGLKRQLAEQFPQDVDSYQDGKDPFIKATERAALSWWRAVPLVLVTGPVGVGKTTLAGALADALVEEGVPTAFVDGDTLTEVHPASPGDPFREGVLLANLEAAWEVYRAAGARCLVLAEVVESQAGVDRCAARVPGAEVTVIQLDASADVIRERLAHRDTGDSLVWHMNRADELQKLFRHKPLGHVTLDASQSLDALVSQALSATGVVGRVLQADEPA